jgi:hypothetical protein
LFYYFCLEDQVPEHHLLKRLDRCVDFSFVLTVGVHSDSHALLDQLPDQLPALDTEAGREFPTLARRQRLHLLQHFIRAHVPDHTMGCPVSASSAFAIQVLVAGGQGQAVLSNDGGDPDVVPQMQ